MEAIGGGSGRFWCRADGFRTTMTQTLIQSKRLFPKINNVWVRKIDETTDGIPVRTKNVQ